MTIKKWTSEEEDFIKDNITLFTNTEFANKLNRTYESISNKIARLKIGKPKIFNVERIRKNQVNKKWTPYKEKFIKDNLTKYSNTELAKIFGCTVISVSGKISNMGLRRPKEWIRERMRENNPMKNPKSVKKMVETIKRRYPNWGDFNIGIKRPYLAKRNRENIRRGKDSPNWNRPYNHNCEYCGKKMELSECFKNQKFCSTRCHGDYILKFGHAPHVMKKIKENRAKQTFPKKDTSIEIKIQNFLVQLKIDFLTHQYMKIKHSYQCDIFVPSMNLVIECDGDYWHGNRNIYRNEKLTERILRQRELDNDRTRELIEKGFRVIRIWENKIVHMDLNQFREKLMTVIPTKK